MSSAADFRETFFAAAPRYEYIETLGRGGMGVVYKVRDRELDEVIAIKVLAAVEDVDRAELLARFKNEISFARRVKHPNVARVFDYGVAADHPYITMEYVEGRDLFRVLGAEGPLTPARAVPILRQIALGTSAAHEAGIVHRDLKPQNVMLDATGGVAILDFGLAHGDDRRTLTNQGTTVGTPAYMSPEQARGKPLDGRSDVYAIGVIAFEMLSGALPFTADSPLAIAVQHLHDPVPTWRLKERSLPPEVQALVLRCLEKDPEKRFKSAAELAAQLTLLERIVRGAPPQDSRIQRILVSDAASAIPPDLNLEVPSSSALRPQADIQTPRRPLPTPAAPSRKPVLLVVDDEFPVRRVVAAHLEAAGFEVKTAESGEAALRFLGDHPADLLVLDVLMPVIDGFDTARIVRSQPAHARLPIVFMSTFVEKNRIAFAAQAGGAEFLRKPLDFKLLAETVRRLLREAGVPLPADTAP